jgi:hypothetical protein
MLGTLTYYRGVIETILARSVERISESKNKNTLLLKHQGYDQESNALFLLLDGAFKLPEGEVVYHKQDKARAYD